MSDLIDRQAAIDAVEKESQVDGAYGYMDTKSIVDLLSDLPSAQPKPSTDIQDVLEYLDDVLHPLISPDNWNVYSDLHDMVSSMLPSAEPRWIPCGESLPEEKVEVLVTVEVDGKKYIESGMLLDVNHGHWETVYDRYVIDVYGRSRNSKVIAWMPLPEPYKEVTE